MQISSRIAFKEWAVICAALARGRQSLILRKGGIHERDGQFQVEHDEFWLFPTYVHQNAEGLSAEGQGLLETVHTERPPEEEVRIWLYAAVKEVIRVDELAAVLRLAGQHIWSPQTVEMRFEYKRPGLFVLPVRIYRAGQPLCLPNSKYFAGCRSWVELPEELSTARAVPVLSDRQFSARLQTIRDALGRGG